MSATAPSAISQTIRPAGPQPLADRIVARAVARDATTTSGIMLPDTIKDKPTRATVVAVGAGRRTEDGRRIPLEVQAGDEILFARYGGAEFTLDGEELLILSEKDILAIVTR
ncbi:MAG: co-chaperone GroES [Chloroflexota bacterium]|nr:co-chaperone GroES [Chloroflexota bacterium]